jgi:peptide/nickel transport system ATP-binding protein
LAEDAVELAPPARGCPFQRRCPVKRGAVCETDTPPAQEAGDGYVIRCHIPLGELRGLVPHTSKS